MIIPRAGWEVAARVERGAEQAGRLDVVGPAIIAHGGETGRDDEEFGRDEIELGGEGEEAGIERGLGLCLFKGFTVVEICVGEDAA